jgi:hypothetical protein
MSLVLLATPTAIFLQKRCRGSTAADKLGEMGFTRLYAV